MRNELKAELRKAAILIQSLDRKSADLLLAQLNRQTASEVMRMAENLDSVSSLEKQLVLSEFLETVQIVSKADGAEKLRDVELPEGKVNLVEPHEAPQGKVELYQGGFRHAEYGPSKIDPTKISKSDELGKI